MNIRIAILLPAALLAAPSIRSATATGGPVRAVVPQLDRMQKWDDMQGDTADPFWADDDNLYHFTCDGRGFGRQQRNISFNQLAGADVEHLVGIPVNSMDEYGKAGAVEADGATWKVTGQECVDGVFYAFVVRNIYGDKSNDPLLRQTSFNASLIKSHDRGKTWTRSAAENYAAPMWPGERFGAPCFIHYGKDGGRVDRDNADRYVYAISNNGFWNGGDDYILGRILRTDLPRLRASDWTYYRGGDGLVDEAWTGELSQAQAILDRPGRLGWTAPVFVPALNRYLLAAWHVTPTLMKWFEPGQVVYEFFEAGHPWGPWTFVSSFDDGFLAPGQHMYGPNLCAKFQRKAGDDVQVDLYTSGCPFEDVRTGLYKNWRIPLTLQTRPPPAVRVVNDDDPAIRYAGGWKAGAKRGVHDHNDDIHYSNTPGDAAEYSFTGTGIALLSEKYADQGSVEIRLDDRPAVPVNLK
ncbi:MAG: hypothetical protein U1F77_03325 [Kiritimatiellia bacterium]